ncbi:hypothetical protein OQZ29_10455 [Pedobacter agri]|uniref:Uncharacterized protein n=1 Tax=Pedobacter agri TaxID=454586 RepID=A0A9X3DFG3_9SPHI|nr:hypothetical protein [Pedobacter agri]MCX3265170.1 hypothetical protein [Pedobacter agri]
MENKELQLNKQKNSNLSILLIVVNLILLLIFANIGDSLDDELSVNYCYLSFGTTVLLGFYAFSYHGKGYRIAKWLFAASLIISALLIGLLLYSAGLAKAFQH